MPKIIYRSEYHIDKLGETIGRDASRMAAALKGPLDALGKAAAETLKAVEETTAAQIRLNEVLRPPRYPQVVIFGRSFDADLVAFSALAVAVLLFEGL